MLLLYVFTRLRYSNRYSNKKHLQDLMYLNQMVKFRRKKTLLFIFCIFQAAGLATMISTMRPDIDNLDEYVRNTTARAFAVVASALGIPSLLPFLKAVCKSKKSWQARHTGIKIVQQIAILMGCAILPHLKNLVEIIEHGKLEKTLREFIM